MPFREPAVYLSCTPASTSISGLQGMRRSRFHSSCESVQHSHSLQFQECCSSLYESWSSLPVLPHFTVRVTHSQVFSEKTSSSHPLEERTDSESLYAVQLFSLLSVSTHWADCWYAEHQISVMPLSAKKLESAMCHSFLLHAITTL